MGGDAVERLGDLLREVGFDGGPYDTLRMESGGIPPAGALVALDRPQEARLAALATLFADAQTVPRREAEQTIRPIAFDDLVAAGLIETEGSGVCSPVSLYPFHRAIVVGDKPVRRSYPDYVAHVAPATNTLASLVIRKPTSTVLDLGTGSGALAFLAARHADRVTAVDINPRALSYARLGQRLNRVDNVDWVEGDWFEPVQGQRFGLVMVNPPYAISPDDTFAYRESSATGDELSRRLVQDSARHLVEGGLAVVLCNWIHTGDEWEDPPRKWAAALGCDALLLHFQSQDPLAYAMTWHSPAVGSGGQEYADAVTRWTTHHKRLGVEKVGWGAIVLRRRTDGPNWIRAFHVGGGPKGAGGDQLERVFAGCDFLEGRSAAAQFGALLSTSWSLVDGHRLDQALRYEQGAYVSGPAVLRQGGLNLSAQVDHRVVPLLAACNGQRPLGELIAGTPPPEGLDQSGFHSLCLETVRNLIATGYLVGKPLEDG